MGSVSLSVHCKSFIVFFYFLPRQMFCQFSAQEHAAFNLHLRTLHLSEHLLTCCLLKPGLCHRALPAFSRAKQAVPILSVLPSDRRGRLFSCAAEATWLFYENQVTNLINLSNHSCIQKVLLTNNSTTVYFFLFPYMTTDVHRLFCGFWIPSSMKAELPQSTHHFPAHTLPNLRHRLDILPMLLRGHPRSEQRHEAEGEDD